MNLPEKTITHNWCLINLFFFFFRPYRGSVLTWSSISYSLRGNTLLEDAYERQDKQPIRRKEKAHRLKGKKMEKKFVKEEKHEWKRQQIL